MLVWKVQSTVASKKIYWENRCYDEKSLKKHVSEVLLTVLVLIEKVSDMKAHLLSGWSTSYKPISLLQKLLLNFVLRERYCIDKGCHGCMHDRTLPTYWTGFLLLRYIFVWLIGKRTLHIAGSNYQKAGNNRIKLKCKTF